MGITGCRILQSPRERLIAMITNSFVPCNGRFPLLITLITLFFTASAFAPWNTLLSTVLLTEVIVFSVVMTLLISKLLSKTILRGMPSSFVLELPPYRVPQVGRVILRSLLDRTVFVLGRAVMTAAPAGLLIWLLSNIPAGEGSVLTGCAAFLDPVGHVFGMDGAILLGFILGFPANEIVLPIVLMIYLSGGSLMETESLVQLHTLLIQNGWTWLTAVCVMIFSLMHWPCATACLTLFKETKSVKWTLLSIAIPAVTGLFLCFVVANGSRLIGLA